MWCAGGGEETSEFCLSVDSSVWSVWGGVGNRRHDNIATVLYSTTAANFFRLDHLSSLSEDDEQSCQLFVQNHVLVFVETKIFLVNCSVTLCCRSTLASRSYGRTSSEEQVWMV